MVVSFFSSALLFFSLMRMRSSPSRAERWMDPFPACLEVRCGQMMGTRGAQGEKLQVADGEDLRRKD